MGHHSDLQGADEIIAEGLVDLEHALRDQRQLRAAEQVAIRGEHREAAQNTLVELIVATRGNYELRRAQARLAGLLGNAAKSVLVLAVLRKVQRRAVEAPSVPPPPHPLPAGVATPVPTGDDDARPTPVRPEPVLALEVDATPDSAQTVPLKPNFTRGPWPAPKPRGRK